MGNLLNHILTQKSFGLEGYKFVLSSCFLNYLLIGLGACVIDVILAVGVS